MKRKMETETNVPLAAMSANFHNLHYSVHFPQSYHHLTCDSDPSSFELNSVRRGTQSVGIDCDAAAAAVVVVVVVVVAVGCLGRP
jgi:hypothetical protein